LDRKIIFLLELTMALGDTHHAVDGNVTDLNLTTDPHPTI
jgi:hypothetical protein